VTGDTAIVAGAPLLFEGVRPGLDGVPYIIDTATHTYNKKDGYRTVISAKLYDGKSGGRKKGGGSESTGGSATEGKVADNAPDGTPATPTEWTNTRRYGRTDEN
jgi:hypothetical protein